MKRFILEMIIFIPFVCVVYVCLLFFWGSNKYIPSSFKENLMYQEGGNGHLNTRLKEVKKTSNVDIVFLGSSHAYQNFDTRIFAEKGYSSFHLGSAGQSHLETQVLIQRYIQRLNPQLVVYEVYPQTFENDGVGSSRDLLSNDINDIYSFIMTLKINHIKTYNTFLYSFLLDIFHLREDFKEPLKYKDMSYVPGGFVEKDIAHYTYRDLGPKEINMRPEQFRAFKQSLKLLKKRNIPVILVYAPIPPSNYNRYKNNQEFDEKMRQLGTYYNFNTLLSLNDYDHFYDYHHLNQIGIKIFNDAFIDILRNQ